MVFGKSIVSGSIEGDISYLSQKTCSVLGWIRDAQRMRHGMPFICHVHCWVAFYAGGVPHGGFCEAHFLW